MATLASGAAVRKAVPAAAGSAAVERGDAPMLMRRWREFTTCGEPVRFLCFDRRGGRWVDVADRAVAEELRRAFRERRVFAEAAVAGRAFLFDFLRMVRIDVATTEETAVAWIDDRGACYFPPPDAPTGGGSRKRGREDDDGDDAASSSGTDALGPADKRIMAPPPPQGASSGTHALGTADKRIMAPPPPQGASSGTDALGPAGKRTMAMVPPPRGAHRWLGTIALQEGDKDYKTLSELFLSSGMASRGAEVTAVRRLPMGPRIDAFKREEQQLRAKRGDATVSPPRYGWYAAPVEDMAAAAWHGIPKINAVLLGARAHGHGVHLSPFPLPSAMLTKPDATGEAHLVLCRVLLGRAEVVAAGSSQFQPSSDACDSAIDKATNPNWYVVWSKDMNTRILPAFVVSFKCPNLHARESSEATSKPKDIRLVPSPVRNPPVAPRDMFPTLIAELGKHVPDHKCQTLKDAYENFKKGNVKKEQLTKFLRNYVGDTVLTTVAKKLHGL